jgi:hypothetical protein
MANAEMLSIFMDFSLVLAVQVLPEFPVQILRTQRVVRERNRRLTSNGGASSGGASGGDANSDDASPNAAGATPSGGATCASDANAPLLA